MADGNKQENPSEGKDCGETNEEIDEDEEEMEFPFDLSEEWMVIDVDEEDEDDGEEIEKTDSLSKDSPSRNEKDGTSKSEAKEPQNYDTAKLTDQNSQTPKKSTEKPRDLKEKGSHKDLSSSKKSDSHGDTPSTRSKSQTLLKPVSSQENKGHTKKDSNISSKSLSNQSSASENSTSVKKRPPEDKKDTKASKSSGKSVSAVDCSRVSTRASSIANTKKTKENTSTCPPITQQTAKDCSEKMNDKTAQSPKSSHPETSTSSTKTPSSQKTQQLPEKSSSGKTANSIDQTSKSSHPDSSASSAKVASSQKAAKQPDKTSSGKTNSSINQTPKSSHPETSASSTKPTSPQKTTKTPVKDSSGKTNNSTNQTSKSSHPESSSFSTKSSPSLKTQKPSDKASSGKTSTNQTSTSSANQTTQAQKATSINAPSKNLASVKKSQEGSQVQVSGKRKDDMSTKEKITSKSDNKSTAAMVTSSSAASVCSVSVTTSETQPPKERKITSETDNKTIRSSSLNKVCENAVPSDQVLSSSATDTVSKAHGLTASTKNGDQKNKSLRFTSPDSNKIPQKDVKASEVIPVEKRPSHVDHGKQKSAQKQMKPVRNQNSTGEIAEAMEELCDIQMHDLDLEETNVKKKMVQSAPVQSASFSPKKRPSHSNCDNVVKKAKYEEKDTNVHFQVSAGDSDIQKDDKKRLKPDDKELSVHKQSAKRIVRRFHRTTQTLPKTTANQLLQCSLGQPPSGSSSKKQLNNCGIQCKIGEHFEDVVSRINSHLTPAVDTLNQEVFKAVLAFDASPIHQDIVAPGTYKYGLRLGQVTQSDVEKNFFKDNCIKKADSYTVSFWKRDCGIVDLLFYEEENFISVINQIRKSRLESRYLCVSMVQRKLDEEKDGENLWDYLKATVVFDQNFVSTGYLSYYKTPIWSKPKVDEFITMHNVPGGVPLSFLSTVFPDAITVLMRDVKVKYTMKGGGVRLGMSRKNGSCVFLKLFKQVLINNFPVVLTQGLSDKRDIPEVQATSKVVAELEKVERERQKGKLCLRSVTAASRDINSTRKKTKYEGKGSSLGNISSPVDHLKKDTVKGSQEAPLDVDSDLSDISELSFSANNLDSIHEGVKSNRAKKEPPQKKIEPKKSFNVAMGSKLLSRARSNLHQAQSKRQERLSGKRPLKSRETKRSPERRSNRTREDFPRRFGTTSNRSKDSRRDEDKQRADSRRVEGRQRADSRRAESGQRVDPHNRRQSDSLQKERLRNRISREKGSIDRLSEGSGSRHGQRRSRDQDHNKSRHDQSPVMHFRRPRSSNRSPEREVLVRSSNRMARSPERYDGGDRVRMREAEGNNYMEFGHPPSSMEDSCDRRISLENPSDLMSDLKRSSEDLRSVLDARKPRHVRLSPRRHGSEERNRFGSPERQLWSPSQERRKRPLSRSPSPRYRKVLVGRRSFSPKNRSRRQHDSHSPQPQPHMTPSPRPGMDLKRDTVRSKVPDFRTVPAAIQPHGSGEQETKEDSMRISKSLFVKLLTNALHGEEGDIVDEKPSQTSKSYSPHRDETERMLSHIRGHKPRSGKDERSHGNYTHIEQRRPDFEEDRSRYGQSGGSEGNFGPGSISGGDVRPIPPPILPPILTSSSTNFSVNKFDPHRPEGPSPSGSQVSQGVWAVPSSSSFGYAGNVRPPPMNERPPFPPPNRESMPPPQNHPPFNTQPPMMFMNARPPFPPSQGPMPNLPPQGIPPPRTGMWQNPRPGPF